MKKWIAKKLINLLSFEWRKIDYPETQIEIKVKLGGTNVLLLVARFDGNNWKFDEFN